VLLRIIGGGSTSEMSICCIDLDISSTENGMLQRINRDQSHSITSTMEKHLKILAVIHFTEALHTTILKEL